MSKILFKPIFMNESNKVSLILKTFNLRPVKAIKYSFDPYTENTQSVRKVMSLLNSKKILKTSTARSKIDVRDDGSDPQMDVTFTDGHKLVFNTKHLKISDIMGRLDNFCKARDTTQSEADMALTKMSGKPKKRK